MIKGVLKNITAISLAFLVMASTMSFTISEHYCGGSLVDASLFVKADTCMMESMSMSSSEESSVISDPCCNDVITIIDGQDEVQQNGKQFAFQQQLFITTFLYTYSALFSNKENSVVSYKDYIPLVLVKDIQVLDETFLI
jgi:uncharacterized protein YfcZ (UPF0381/DUF406 family)